MFKDLVARASPALYLPAYVISLYRGLRISVEIRVAPSRVKPELNAGRISQSDQPRKAPRENDRAAAAPLNLS